MSSKILIRDPEKPRNLAFWGSDNKRVEVAGFPVPTNTGSDFAAFADVRVSEFYPNASSILLKGSSTTEYVGMYANRTFIGCDIISAIGDTVLSASIPITPGEGWINVGMIWNASDRRLTVYKNLTPVVSQVLAPGKTFNITGNWNIGSTFSNYQRSYTLIRNAYIAPEAFTPIEARNILVPGDEYVLFPIRESSGTTITDTSGTITEAITGATWEYENFSPYNPLISDTDAGLIMTAHDPVNFSFGRASKTYGFQLPKTGENIRLLTGKRLIPDALLIENGIELLGTLYLDSETQRAYSSQMVVGSGVVWADLGDKNLKADFDWSALNHTLNLTNANSTTLAGGNIIYDYIFRGVIYNHEVFENTAFIQDIAQRHPAIRFKSIIDKIFEGYTVEQNVWDVDEYNSLYMLFTQPTARNTQGWAAASVASAEGDGGAIAPVLLVKDGSVARHYFTGYVSGLTGPLAVQGTTGYRYTVGETGSYAFMVNIQGQYSIGTDTLETWINRKQIARVRVTRGMTEFYIYNEEKNLPPLQAINNEEFSFKVDTRIIELQAGDLVDIEILYENEQDGQPVPPINQTISGTYTVDAFIRAIPWEGFGFGSTVPGSWIVPDMTVREFLQVFCEQFNLEIYPSFERKKVIFQNRYATSKGVVDITERVVAGSVSAVKTPVPDNYLLGYTRDNRDGFGLQVIDNTPGGRDVLVDNGSRDVKQIRSRFSEAFTAPGSLFPRMTTTPPPPVGFTEGGDAYPFPTYSTVFNMRFLYFTGTQASGSGQASAGIPTPTIQLNATLPIFKQVRGDYTLAYKDENGKTGVFNRYFGKYVTDLSDKTVIELDLIVDPQLLNNLHYIQDDRDFTQNYYIGIPEYEGVYQIVEINKQQNNIFRAKLFKISEYEPEFI
jgi:hypothetical protein